MVAKYGLHEWVKSNRGDGDPCSNRDKSAKTQLFVSGCQYLQVLRMFTSFWSSTVNEGYPSFRGWLRLRSQTLQVGVFVS